MWSSEIFVTLRQQKEPFHDPHDIRSDIVRDVSERKIRFTSNLPLKELLEKIEDIERWDSEYENEMD
ncbi:hypothetical protein FRX31_007856, partial [Thalictrum thalictroides]